MRTPELKLRIPQRLAALTPYQPGKPIEEVEREMGLADTVKLASNENPLGPSPKALEAARKALLFAHRYPDGSGYYLRHALSAKLGVPPRRIVLGNGSTELVELLARTFLGEDGKAVISEGAFVMYGIAVQAAGGEARFVPQAPGYRHDAAAMAAAVGSKTRLMFFANPNNPTGTYIRDHEMAHVLQRVPQEVLVIVDEAYHEYVSVPDYPVNIPRLERHPNLILLRTFSKVHGLAGLRIGYALVGSDEIAETLERVRSPFNTSSIAQAAAIAALNDDEHILRSSSTNLTEMKFLEKGLASMGVSFVSSVANFVLVLLGPRAEEISRAMLGQGVIVRAMRFFGFPEAVRITVGTRSENERCLSALSRSLRQAGGPGESGRGAAEVDEKQA